MNYKKLLCLVIGHMWESQPRKEALLARRRCSSCEQEQMMLSDERWVNAKKRVRK